MHKTSKPQKMQNSAKKTDLTNLNFIEAKRPVQVVLRDPRTKARTLTLIYVDSDDPRSDYEVAKEYKEQYKLSRQLHRARMRELKLSKNAQGTASGPYRWEYKDPDDQLKLDLDDSLNAIHQLMDH